MKKEGNMRINSYNFEDFKTIKDLYEQLVLDYSESVKADYTSEDFIKAGIAKECTTCPDFCEEDCIENAECARGNDVFEGCKKSQYFDTDSIQPNKTISAKIENINHCPNQDTCCIVSPCEQVHKHMKAINNPNWHTVKLAIVNSNDFVRLNEKLKLYISTYRELKQTLSYLRKCKTINTYDSCYLRYIKKQNDMRAKSKFTDSMLNYIRAKLSMQNVESGVWA